MVIDDGGSSFHRLIKVPLNELEEWDQTHDPLGRKIDSSTATGKYENFTAVNEEPKV